MNNGERFSDLRVLRWTDRINAAIDGKRVGPIRAAIDLTNLCNHSCPWCEPLEFRKETIADRKHTLETSIAIEVLQELAMMNCKTINFSGGGEPTLHLEFGQILRFAVRSGMRTWVVTNGSLIDKWLDDLTYAHHVRVSLDASNEAEHMEMHGSKAGEFDKVCENIRVLCKARDKTKSHRPEVGVAYIVADCNVGGIERAMGIAANRGVDFIHFRPLSEETPKKFTQDWEPLVAKIEDMAHLWPTLKVFPMAKRWRDVFQQRDFKKCYSALTNAVIGANGDVAACCDERTKVFGNVNEQSFRSIWLGATHRRMADAIAPQLCGRCLQCSYNAAVERFVVGNEALPELV